MSEIKKIILKILVPNRRRKGNVLSSLLDFFIGSIERLVQFEHGFFRISTLFKHKYCKQCLIIITTLLFLVSSFEWTGQQINNNQTDSYLQQVSLPVAEGVTAANVKHNCYTADTLSGRTFPAKHNIFYSYATPTFRLKKHLFICSLLI